MDNDSLFLPFFRRTKDGTIVFRSNLGCLTDDCPHWNDGKCSDNSVKETLCILPQDPWWPEN
jgi:hypothetical protein